MGGKSKRQRFFILPQNVPGINSPWKTDGRHPLLNEFFRGVVAFEEHLGPVFVQVSDTFSPKRKQELFDFLLTLPKDLQFFLEVRHPDWFGKEKEREMMFEFLKANNMGAVITDTAGRRDCAHMHLTIPKAFVRYVGNSLHRTDYARTDTWVERMKYWLDHGLQELFFFIHMHDEATSPELTVYLVDKMNAMCGLYLIKPKFISEEKGKKPGVFA